MHALALLLQDQPDPEVIKKMMVAMFAIMPIIMIIGLAIVIIPTWFICKKAGFSPWLSLLGGSAARRIDPDVRARVRGMEGCACGAGRLDSTSTLSSAAACSSRVIKTSR